MKDVYDTKVMKASFMFMVFILGGCESGLPPPLIVL